MIRFYNWYYLLLLILIPLFYFLKAKKYISISSTVFCFSDSDILAKLPSSWKVKYLRKHFHLMMLVFALIIIAMARPQYGSKVIEQTTHGVDIMLAVDVSGSMLAEDFQPQNRLNVAKEVLKEFLLKRTHDRMGLVIFAGDSYLQVPLTMDKSLLVELVGSLKTGMIKDGTAVGMAIATSVSRLKKSDAKSKIIVLLTDGDNNSGTIDPETAAKVASAMEVKIYSIGIGKPGNEPVPFPHPQYGKIMAKITMNEDLLKSVSSISEGRYFRAENAKQLKEVYKIIDSLERSEINIKEYDNYSERAYVFILLALILWGTDLFVRYVLIRKVSL